MSAPRPARITQRQHVLGRWVHSQSQSARWLRYGLAVLAIVLVFVRLNVAVRALLPPAIYRKDFLQEYTLARAIVDRIDPYLPTDVLAARYVGAFPGTLFPHPTPHPPTVGILFLPLALFDYSTAAILWFGLEMACLVVSVYLLGRAVGARLSGWATLGMAAALLIWYPFSVEIAWGQVQVPMLALLAGAWVALRSGRSLLGGALVGLTVLIKPVVLPLLLLFVLRKDSRALMGAALVILLGLLVAGCWVGLDTLETYFTTVLPLVTDAYRSCSGNISIWSLGWRVFNGTGCEVVDGIVLPPMVQSAEAAHVASGALLCLLLWVASVAVRKQHSLDVSLGVMICVSILTSPISWAHYLVLAAIPMAQVIRWLVCHDLPSRETNRALIVAILLTPNWVGLATLLVGRVPITPETIILPYALAQLPLMTAVAVGALAWLVASLGPAQSSMPVTVEN